MWRRAALITALLAAAALWVWWKVRRNRRVGEDRIDYVRSCCDSTPSDETILVLLRCAPGDHECGWSLFSLFELAHCPLRVFVSTVEDPAADSMKGSPRSRSSQRTFEPELEQKSAGARPTESRTGFSPLRAIGNTIPYLW